MLDIKLLREQPEAIKAGLARRKVPIAVVDALLDLDSQQRQCQTQRNELQAESNSIGKQVGAAIKAGSDPKGADIVALRDRGTVLKNEIATLETQERELAQALETQLLTLPNLPQAVVPNGADETANVEVKRWGDHLKDRYGLTQYKPHEELAEALGLIEFERAVKVSQSRFVAMMGLGAALERALINLMLKRHVEAGYREFIPPLLVNSDTMRGTGQLPKFAEDSFRCADDDLWLIPTSEVPLTNLYREEIISSDQLPFNFCAHTPCFRREAGSYGKDTRGLIRLHQFNKVEMVKITHPDHSEVEHQKLVADAEAILQLLELPYRIIELCTGDLGFSASRCYDLEVWFPAQGQYREISSCSNCWDFQARRANIRCKEPGQKGTQFVHTLNGSGVAIGRAMAAILENYQQADGSVIIPTALQPFMPVSAIAQV